MGDFRSKSYKNEQLDNTYGYYGTNFGDNNANFKPNSNPSGMQDLRCYSASYASSSAQSNGQLDIVVAGGGGEQWKFKKGKSTNGADARSWALTDPELQRKKRVASYKAYTVEGKVKGSFKKSFRWIKERYTLMVYGYRNVTALPSCVACAFFWFRSLKPLILRRC
ncbi:hypothetical protein SASPL_112848 [Salvia splendens]|uniref:Uncharacterized protein n=2 Tax=Salvia splendens TaxID=180675 RepID=A0A8X8YF13_SALSN|nr:hypothetical protein SASPL_112848 [Salvia splendens]